LGLPAVSLAEPPGNDAQTAPLSLDATSGVVAGTTEGATVAKTDPASPCDDTVTATVWYSLVNVPQRNVVLRLTAQGGLNAVVAVYRVRNNRLSALECDETGSDGVATIGFAAQNGDLVLIGQLTGSPPGAFQLRALVPAPPEAIPGRALRGTVHASVEQYLNETDLWHVGLRAGKTYRISLIVGKSGCVSVALFRPGGPPSDARQVLYLRCNRAASFTPGPNGGGQYLLLVSLSYSRGRVPYRLQVAAAQPDDTAPGLKLPVGLWHAGRLNPTATDQLDMYRFVLASPSDVIIQLGRPWAKHVSLLLLQDTGKSLAAGRAIRRRLAPGTYFAVVSAPTGTAAARYRLLLRERGVSSLSAPGLVNGHVPLGTPLTLSALLGEPVGRIAKLQIDRFDPLEGWLFLRTYTLHVGADDTSSFVWKPSHVGSYRARITAPSRSGYLYITVDEPPPTTTG
jgi:hypothetical protein